MPLYAYDGINAPKRLLIGVGLSAVEGSDYLLIAMTGSAGGSWTPVLAGSVTGGNFTYTTQVGRYQKIGNMVFISFNIHISATSIAPSGNLTITGLPFTSVNITGYRSSVTLAWDNLDTAATTLMVTGRISENATIMDFVESGDNINALLFQANKMGAIATIFGSAYYETS